jgi:hypothetical protein
MTNCNPDPYQVASSAQQLSDNPVSPTVFPDEGTPLFLYSDNPETITMNVFRQLHMNANGGVLWQHTVTANPTGLHRVYFWHVNATEVPWNIAVAMSSPTNETVMVTSVHGISLGTTGALIANQLLQPRPLHPFVSVNLTNQLANLIWGPCPFSGFMGCLILIRNIPMNLSYTLRVLYQPVGSNNWNQAAQQCAPALWDAGTPGHVNIHPRGSWPYSEAFQLFTYTGGTQSVYIYSPGLNLPGVFTDGTSSKAEHCDIQQGCQPMGGSCAHTNWAPFGAIVHLQITFEVGCQVYLWICAPFGNDPQAYANGSVRATIQDGPPGPVQDWPRLLSRNHNAYQIQFPLQVPYKPNVLVVSAGTQVMLDWTIAGGSSGGTYLVIVPA